MGQHIENGLRDLETTFSLRLDAMASHNEIVNRTLAKLSTEVARLIETNIKRMSLTDLNTLSNLSNRSAGRTMAIKS